MPRTFEACRSFAFVSPPASWEISGPGSRDERGRDHPDGLERGLAARRLHQRADRLHALGRVGDAHRSGEPGGDDLIAAAGVGGGAHRDRHGDRHPRDLGAELCVIAAKRPEQRRQERVVDRPADGLGGGTQLGELDIERGEAPRHPAPAKQRRALGALREHAPERRPQAQRLARRGLRPSEHPQRGRCAARELSGQRQRVAFELVAELLGRRAVLGDRRQRLRLVGIRARACASAGWRAGRRHRGHRWSRGAT